MATSSRLVKTRIKAKTPLRAEHGNSLRVAFQQIREMIVHGKLSPGTWIVEADIAEHLWYEPYAGARSHSRIAARGIHH